MVVGDDVVDDLGDEGNAGEEMLAEGGVHLDGAALAFVEAVGLGQDRVGNADLADVVEEGGVAKLGISRELRVDHRGQFEREVGDASGVLAGLVVSELERRRERLDGEVVAAVARL